jgi:hypothetical protein
VAIASQDVRAPRRLGFETIATVRAMVDIG